MVQRNKFLLYPFLNVMDRFFFSVINEGHVGFLGAIERIVVIQGKS